MITCRNFLILFIFTLALYGCSPGSPRTEVPQSSGGLLTQQLIVRYGQVEGDFERQYLDYLSARLQRALRSRTPPPLYRITLLATTEPLALSPGGGKILISRGLVLNLATESELAFIIAHEIAHDYLGHIALQQQGKPISTPRLQRMEIEADRFAVGLIALAGYDPRQATSALAQAYLAARHPSAEGHPDVRERIAAITDYIARSSWRPPGTINRRDFTELQRSLWQRIS